MSEQKSDSAKKTSFADIPETALARAYSFLDDKDAKSAARTSRKFNSFNKNSSKDSTVVWGERLRPDPERKIGENPKKIFDNNPEKRLASYWPLLEGDKAISFYQTILQENKNNLDARSGLIYWSILKLKSPHELAEQQFEAIENNHDSNNEKEEKIKNKIQEIIEILSSNPEHANSFYYLGKLIEQGYYTLSEEDFSKSWMVETTPDVNKNHQAAAFYRKALSINPRHPQANYCIGFLFEERRAFLKKGKDYPTEDPAPFEEIVARFYRRALAYEPDNYQYPFYAEIRHRLARLILRNKIKALSSDFHEIAMPLTRIRQYETLCSISPDPELPDYRTNFDYKREKDHINGIRQIPKNKWTKTIREKIIDRIEELTPEQQAPIFEASFNNDDNYVRLNSQIYDDPEFVKAIRPIKSLISLGSLAILGTGIYGGIRIRNSDLIQGGIGSDQLIAIFSIELMLTILLALYVFSWRFFVGPEDLPSLQQDFIVRQIERAIAENRSLYNLAGDEIKLTRNVETPPVQEIKETSSAPMGNFYRESPRLFNSAMNDAEKRSTLLAYLHSLRARGLLLTSEEFLKKDIKQFKSALFSPRGALEEMVGNDYLAKIIHEKKLNHIKIPQKVHVLGTKKSFYSMIITMAPEIESITKDEDSFDRYESVERLENRFASQEAIGQLLDLMEITDCPGYSFFFGKNLAGEEGIYVNSAIQKDLPIPQFPHYSRAYRLVDPKEREWLQAEIKSRKENFEKSKAEREHPVPQELAEEKQAGSETVQYFFDFSLEELVGQPMQYSPFADAASSESRATEYNTLGI